MQRVRHRQEGRGGTVVEALYEGCIAGLTRVHLDGDEPGEWHFYADDVLDYLT